MSVFVDTSILIYAAGTDHPLRGPCVAVMNAVDERRIEAVTSAEVVQEILHRFLAIRRPDIANALARSTLDTFAPVLPITHALMRRVPELAARYPGLAARDLIHVATCIHEGIGEILSTDRGFDAVAEVRRIPPEEFTTAVGPGGSGR